MKFALRRPIVQLAGRRPGPEDAARFLPTSQMNSAV
jgi:hypothetical protein